MAIGIWTPVYLSNQQITFPDRLNNFANKLQQVTVAAGTHMRFTNLGCGTIFIHTAAPTTDAIGFTGVPVNEDTDIVLPRVSPIWIYCPYENMTINVDVGALT